VSSRREHRGLPLRTDRQILASEQDMLLLAAVAAGAVTRSSSSATAAFLLDDTPVQLRRLAQEELLFAPISGLPTLQPRGARLLAVQRGELPMPMGD
jgi:hypothetical protein